MLVAFSEDGENRKEDHTCKLHLTCYFCDIKL